MLKRVVNLSIIRIAQRLVCMCGGSLDDSALTVRYDELGFI